MLTNQIRLFFTPLLCLVYLNNAFSASTCFIFHTFIAVVNFHECFSTGSKMVNHRAIDNKSPEMIADVFHYLLF